MLYTKSTILHVTQEQAKAIDALELRVIELEKENLSLKQDIQRKDQVNDEMMNSIEISKEERTKLAIQNAGLTARILELENSLKMKSSELLSLKNSVNVKDTELTRVTDAYNKLNQEHEILKSNIAMTKDQINREGRKPLDLPKEEIYQEYKRVGSLRKVGEMYDVSHSTVSKIVSEMESPSIQTSNSFGAIKEQPQSPPSNRIVIDGVEIDKVYFIGMRSEIMKAKDPSEQIRLIKENAKELKIGAQSLLDALKAYNPRK